MIKMEKEKLFICFGSVLTLEEIVEILKDAEITIKIKQKQN